MPNAITRSIAARLLPPRPQDGHKGNFGHVFVIAGSRGFSGAVRLACESAGRAGCGLVTAGIPASLANMAAITLLESMSMTLPETPDQTISSSAIEPALTFAATKSAAVVGPGISTHPGTWAFVHGFVAKCAPPLVVDADGLNIIAEDLAPLSDRDSCTTILTPHPGEMARLARISSQEVQANRESIARQLASATQSIVVLKGHETVVAHPDGTIAINTTGNHGMATGGTGDVLAGLLGGLLAQGMTAWDAARLGVWLHGYAGDCAASQFTARAMLARDLLACIPHAFGALETVG